IDPKGEANLNLNPRLHDGPAPPAAVKHSGLKAVTNRDPLVRLDIAAFAEDIAPMREPLRRDRPIALIVILEEVAGAIRVQGCFSVNKLPFKAKPGGVDTFFDEVAKVCKRTAKAIRDPVSTVQHGNCPFVVWHGAMCFTKHKPAKWKKHGQ